MHLSQRPARALWMPRRTNRVRPLRALRIRTIPKTSPRLVKVGGCNQGFLDPRGTSPANVKDFIHRAPRACSICRSERWTQTRLWYFAVASMPGFRRSGYPASRTFPTPATTQWCHGLVPARSTAALLLRHWCVFHGNNTGTFPRPPIRHR